jgi:hypothetical protein
MAGTMAVRGAMARLSKRLPSVAQLHRWAHPATEWEAAWVGNFLAKPNSSETIQQKT